MKSFCLFTSAALLGIAACGPLPADKDFKRVALEEPLNWVAGPKLFPKNIMKGYNAEYDQYNASTWAKHILNECKALQACSSTISFSGINTGTPPERFWFGYIFGGASTTPRDYVRDLKDGVQDSVAYTRG